ncbi:MAG TPA: PHB depolymerase family esterase [Polyangiales bacterium]|nr:PHB depolymerase family esterase [Polyangiales bacterium]
MTGGLRRVLISASRVAAALAVMAGCKRDAYEARALADRMLAGRIARPGMAYEIVYRLLVPAGYDKARRYPLIVFLHGSGANGDDNRAQVAPELARLNQRAQAMEPVFLLAPQCPKGDKWITGDRGAPHLNHDQSQRVEADAIKLVFALLDELAGKYSIDQDRIYVTGHSSGAAGTWDIISRRADGRFAAAVPVTGTNDPSRAKVIARLPIWVFHGALDDVSPVQNAREMVTALRALGSPVRYTEYADVGHGTLGRAYDEPELLPWLLAQRRQR